MRGNRLKNQRDFHFTPFIIICLMFKRRNNCRLMQREIV